MYLKHFISIVFTLFLLSSCKQEKRYHTNTGLIYQVYPETPNPKYPPIKIGNTVKIRLIQKVGDSVMDDNYNKMPLYYSFTPGYGNRYNPLEVFDYGLHENDSVVTTQRIDSMLHKGIFKTIPKWMKGSDEWITRFKVLKVFTNDSLLQADKMAETKKVNNLLSDLGKKEINAYLMKKAIKATVSANGIYREMLKKGSGAEAVTGKNLTLEVSLTSLSGKKLNNTRDPKSKGPLQFILGRGYFPPVIESQLHEISAGSHFRLYVPGVLLFGIEPRTKGVKQEDNWIFDMELLAVK